MKILDSDLMGAVEGGNAEEVKQLINSGANVNAKHYKNITALHRAVARGNAEIVKILIDAKSDINAADDDGYTALHQAALKGNAEFAELLIKAEADVNAVNKKGETALYVSIDKGRIEKFVKVLIESGANPDIKTREDKTAWDLIKGKKRMELVFNKALEKWYETL